MADTSSNKLFIELGIALLIGLMAVGIVSHAGPTSLDGDSYAQALRILSGQPDGGSEMFARALFSALGPVMGWKANAAGLIGFYLWAPMILLFISAGLAYAVLRLWRFGRLEAAGAALLTMLTSPIAFAFYPGLWLPETAAILLTLIGLAGLAGAAREKDGSLKSGFSFISLVISVAGFGAAAYVLPWMAAVPLSIFVGELLLVHRDVASLWRVPTKAVRLLALLLPVGLAIALHPPAFTLSVSGTLAFLFESRFALGFAAVSLPALLLLDEHPLAPLLSGAAIVGVLFGTASPAAAMLCLLLPIAYGIRTLGLLGGQPVWFKATVFGLALAVTGLGLFVIQMDWAQIAGLCLMVAAGGVSIAFVYKWPSGLMRLGLLTLLLGGALLTAVQDLPGQGSGGPYHYSPLSPGVQTALQWIGRSSEAGAQPRVAVIAPPAAIQLLAHGVSVSDNDTWVRYLASSNNSLGPLRAGDYVVAYPELFGQIKQDELALSQPWTLVPFQFAQTASSQGQLIAVFFNAEQGIILQQTMLDSQTLSSDKPQLYSAATGQPAGALYSGDTALLMPDQNFNAPGNLLLWYNQDYKANVLRLFRDNGATFKQVYANDTVQIRQVMG